MIPLDPIFTTILSIVEIFLVPLIIFLMQRGMGKKLDTFDEKRDKAREELQKNKEQDTE